MFIRCETDNHYDRYYLPDINELIDLKVYADTNMPIKCYKVDYRYLNNVYLEEDLIEVYLYLNNYLHYYKLYSYLKTIEEYENILEEQCSLCSDYKHNWGCQSTYKENKNNKCYNYKEKITVYFWDWVKDKLGIK